MLKAIINYLNLKLDLLNYFDLTRCLSELKSDNEGRISPNEYISNGEYDSINFDEYDGVSYWRLRDEITSERTETVKYVAGAKNNIETTVPLRLVFSIRKSKLTVDDAYSFDRIRQTILKQLTIDDGILTTTLGADRVRIDQVGSISNPKALWDEETESTGTFEPKYDVVFGAVDIDVVITSKYRCLPAECDDVDSDILHSFDFCDTAIQNRLTDAQITCLEDWICDCDAATVRNSDSSYSTTIASGATLVLPNITFTDSDGSVSSVPSVQDITATQCSTPSLSIAASTSTPNFGDSITITATPTNITPTSYTFSITNGTQSRVFIQASAVLNWDVDMYGTVTVGASATSGAVATAIVASTTLTVSLNITKSLSQDGTNDYNVIAFDRTNDEAFSVTTWVKMLVTAQDCPFICLYSVDDTSNRPRLAVGYRQSTGNIECFAWNDFWNNNNNSAITSDTDWHHLALTYDGSGDVNVYWDGGLIINVSSAINNQLDTLVMGWAQGWPSVGARFGNQRTTDTAIHSVELTSGQVATLAATLGASSGYEVIRFPYIDESAGQTTGVVTDIERGIRSNLVNFTAPYGIVTDAP